jgi:RimJ/RimL family protein N-acetyltransferase
MRPIFAQEREVELVRGKGSKNTGGGPGGFFWKIMYNGKSAGKVFINWIDIEPIGKHASIQIFLNKGSQGKHIGRIAYERACDLSEYREVYAHMRKTNLASYKSAIAAGFKERKIAGISQRLMRWVRK